jgi:hypothetical protein
MQFGKLTGLILFWNKYWNSSKLGLLKHKYEFKPVNSILKECHKNKNMLAKKFDLIVFVSTQNTPMKCLQTYKNISQFLIVLHHPEPTSHVSSIVHWNNVYAASENEKVLQLTSRHFTPSEMPLPSSIPNCQKHPIFIVQGGLQPNRRNLEELSWYLELKSKYNFIVRIMTKNPNPNMNDPFKRIEFHQLQTMIKFNEAFLDGAFLLPLISPEFEPTKHYFQGHPTSNIAYASHFNLRVIGHRGILDSYKYELRNNIGYWHNGTKESAILAIENSLMDFNTWCKNSKESNYQWGKLIDDLKTHTNSYY